MLTCQMPLKVDYNVAAGVLKNVIFYQVPRDLIKNGVYAQMHNRIMNVIHIKDLKFPGRKGVIIQFP